MRVSGLLKLKLSKAEGCRYGQMAHCMKDIGRMEKQTARVVSSSDGDVYVGTWRDDKADGFGIYSH